MKNEFLRGTISPEAERKQAKDTLALASTIRLRYIDLLNNYGDEAPGNPGKVRVLLKDSVNIYAVKTKYTVYADISRDEDAQGRHVPDDADTISVIIDGFGERFIYEYTEPSRNNDIDVTAQKEIFDEKGKSTGNFLPATYDDVYNYGGLLNIIESQPPKPLVKKPILKTLK